MQYVRGHEYPEGYSHKNKPKTRQERGKAVGILNAREQTPDDRYSHDYRCLNPVCMCTYHWRDEVNSEVSQDTPDTPVYKRARRPATYVKDPSSSHVDGCGYDYKSVEQQNDNVFVMNDQLAIMVNFKLDTPVDQGWGDFPDPLSPQMARAISGRKGKGFENLQQVTAFLYKNFGSIDDPGIDDVVLVTPHNEIVPLSDVLVRETESDPLLIQDPNHTFGIVKMKPEQKIDRSAHATYFECEPIYNESARGKGSNTPSYIKPIIRIYESDGVIEQRLQQFIDAGRPIMVSGMYTQIPDDDRDPREVFITVRNLDQITPISRADWSPPVELPMAKILRLPVMILPFDEPK